MKKNLILLKKGGGANFLIAQIVYFEVNPVNPVLQFLSSWENQALRAPLSSTF